MKIQTLALIKNSNHPPAPIVLAPSILPPSRLSIDSALLHAPRPMRHDIKRFLCEKCLFSFIFFPFGLWTCGDVFKLLRFFFIFLFSLLSKWICKLSETWHNNVQRFISLLALIFVLPISGLRSYCLVTIYKLYVTN